MLQFPVAWWRHLPAGYNSNLERAFLADARSAVVLQCKDCPHWNGGEDYGYGSCRLKLQRDEQRFLTFGQQECDEGVDPDVAAGGEGDD